MEQQHNTSDKKHRIFLYAIGICLIIAIVLMALPNSSALGFGQPTEDFGIKINIAPYSYFNLIHFGYANFAPNITAVLTIVCCILLLLNFILKKRVLASTMLYILPFALLSSIFVTFRTAKLYMRIHWISFFICILLSLSLVFLIVYSVKAKA